jgi:hypothetical protein
VYGEESQGPQHSMKERAYIGVARWLPLWLFSSLKISTLKKNKTIELLVQEIVKFEKIVMCKNGNYQITAKC